MNDLLLHQNEHGGHRVEARTDEGRRTLENFMATNDLRMHEKDVAYLSPRDSKPLVSLLLRRRLPFQILSNPPKRK